MNISTIKGVKLEAISACVPSNKVNNRDFAKNHFEDDLNSTITALGVEERHVVKLETTTALDLCVVAANKIFESDIKKEEIGAIIFVTLTPDFLMPNNASYVQHLLSLPNDIPTYDINHACSGYIFGLWNAAIVAQNLNKKVLLLDGDVNTHYVSPYDKSTSLLFGDAGTATIISPDVNNEHCWNFTFNTDGSNRDAILMRLGFRNLISQELLESKLYSDGSQRRFIDMQMDGRRVFDYVLDKVPEIITEFMDELETGSIEYDKLLIHQANQFMLRKLAKTIGFSKDVMPISMDKYGNTSSASIPLTICSELNQEKEINKVLLVGMGAGLTTGIGDINISGMQNFGVFEEDI